MKRQHTNIK